MQDDKVLGSTVRIDCTTHDSTGALVAPSSAFAASDFRIYKDGSAAEKTTTNGITVTSPFDSITGKHLIEIDTSNSTGDVGFWAAGSDYRVEINSAKTVSSIVQTGVVIGRFSLVAAGVLRPTVDGRTLDVSAGGEAGIDWANIGNPTTTVAFTGSTISTSQTVASVSGAVGSVSGNIGGNVTGSVGSVVGNVGGNVAGSVGSVSSAVTVGTNNDKTGYSLVAGTGLGNQTANITGSLSGSVGSVTGAVGSVTGAVVLDSATNTQIDNIENASGYLLAVLAGACADPQTASETYAITVFGSTFTVDMAGQTSTGTRTAPTLTKS